jgi:hypothetical protein
MNEGALKRMDIGVVLRNSQLPQVNIRLTQVCLHR